MVEKFLTRKQTAEALGIHPCTLDRKWRSGKFPPPAEILGRPMWTEADVEEGLTLEILDAAGRRIRMETVRRVPIAIDGLNVSGMYIVRITGKDGTTYTGRLIVK